MLNLSYIAPKHLPQVPEGMINFGNCFNWALAVVAEHRGVRLWSSRHHAFVQLGSLWYDASHPSGTTDLDNMTQEGEAKRIGLQRFIRFWAKHGAAKVSDQIVRLVEKRRKQRMKTSRRKRLTVNEACESP